MKVALKSYKDALEMLIDIFMENKYMVMRIDKGKLFENIKKNMNYDIKKSIAMPILSYIVNDDDYSKVFVDFANYMNANNFMTIRDLLSQDLNEDKKRVVFFLRHICTVDI